MAVQNLRRNSRQHATAMDCARLPDPCGIRAESDCTASLQKRLPEQAIHCDDIVAPVPRCSDEQRHNT